MTTYLVTLTRVNKENKFISKQLPTFKYQVESDTDYSEVANKIVTTFNEKDTCGYEYIIQDIKALNDFKYMDDILKSII